MRILVTGGAGFIGSNLTEQLLRQDHEVIILDNFDPFYPKELKIRNLSTLRVNGDFKFIEGDIRNRSLVETVMSDNKPEVVVHLAAKAGVRPSIEHPEEYFDVNIMGTMNLLEAMRKHQVRKLIFASSSSVYGNNPKLPFSEVDPVDHPISPYAASKKAGELICHTFHSLYAMDIFCLRFFTVFGPRQRPDLAIYKFVSNALLNNPITIYGDGETSRDYTYVDDVVDGIYSAIWKVKGYEIINLGGADPVRLIDLVQTIEKVLGKKIQAQTIEKQEGDVERTFADVKKASELLGYAPKVNLEEGIRRFIEWKRMSIGSI